MHEHNLKSIGLHAAQRAVNAGGLLLKVAEPFYSGGYVYTHVLHTVRGTMYRVARTIAADIRMSPQRSALQCAARACSGCTVCSNPPNVGAKAPT